MTITGLPAGSVTEGTTVALGSTVASPSAVLQSAGFSESWTVQFGRATYGLTTGRALNLTLGSVGSYTVALTATEAEGISSTTTQTITAADTAPVVTPSASPTVQPPEQATITAYNLGSVLGPGLDNKQPGFVTVNWGDGTLATSFQISSQGSLGFQGHAYELPGKYQVTVTVTDVYGLSGSESFTTTVAPVAPSPEIQSAPASMNAGSSVTLSSSVTDLSQAETAAGYTYAWSVLRNGSPYTLPGSPLTSGPSLMFAPTLSGSYTISLSTTDSSGSVGVAPAQTIVVNNLDTTTSLASSGNPSASGQSVTFTATVSITEPRAAERGDQPHRHGYVLRQRCGHRHRHAQRHGHRHGHVYHQHAEHREPPHHGRLHERRRQLQRQAVLSNHQPARQQGQSTTTSVVSSSLNPSGLRPDR